MTKNDFRRLAIEFAKTKNDQHNKRRVDFYEKLFASEHDARLAGLGKPIEPLQRQIRLFYNKNLG